MIKNKNRGDLLTAGARGRGAEGEHFSFSRFTLADVFEKNEKKNKTTSVYRLNEDKTDWFRSQGPRFYSSDFDLKIRVLVGIGVGGDVSELVGVV